MPKREPREIGDDEELTQYGTTTEPFHNEPRWSKENALSLILGGWEPLGASEKVRGYALDDGTDAARYTNAGTLRAAGFTVTNTPTNRNPDHVSAARDGAWTADVCHDFDGCFGEVAVADKPDVDEDEEGGDDG